MKRALDIAGGVLGLLLLLMPLLVIALAVAASSGLPVFFRQTRIGWRGRPFELIKFRSMTVLPGSERGSFDAGSTQRITPIGRFLRRTKLDELPQLWNVLKGDMSLVGPRPEVQKWVEAFPERWKIVHQVRPGITDPASIEFREEESLLAGTPDPEHVYREVILPRKLDLYEAYARHHTVLGDMRILVRTLLVLLRARSVV